MLKKLGNHPYKCFKLDSWLQVAGMEPLNLLFARFRLWRRVMLPRKSGNVPDKSFSCNSLLREQFITMGKIQVLKLLRINRYAYKLAKNFNFVIDGEIFPENPFEPRVLQINAITNST